MTSRRKVVQQSQQQGSAEGEKGGRVSNGDYTSTPSAIGQNRQNKNPWDQRGTGDLKTAPSSTAAEGEGQPPPEAPPGDAAQTVRDAAAPPLPVLPASPEERDAAIEDAGRDVPALRSVWGRVVAPVLAVVLEWGVWRRFVPGLLGCLELHHLAAFAEALVSLQRWPGLVEAMRRELASRTRTSDTPDAPLVRADVIARELAHGELSAGAAAVRLRARAVGLALVDTMRSDSPAVHCHGVLLPEDKAQQRAIGRLFASAEHARTWIGAPPDDRIGAALLWWLGERAWDPAWTPAVRAEVHAWAQARAALLGHLLRGESVGPRPAALWETKGGVS